MVNIENYYLDESGSTGDLINADESLDFGKQQIFVLACVGVDDLSDLSLELERLKKVHRIQSPELKSKALRTKPQFTGDLIAYLNGRDLPIMIEIVEKRYFICATMVNHLIFPPVCLADLEQEGLVVREVFANFLCDHIPDAIISSYVRACGTSSTTAIGHTFGQLISWLGNCHGQNVVAHCLRHATQESSSEFQVNCDEGQRDWKGLPIPDKSKTGRLFWILPNLSSFTNIYARLNHGHQKEVGRLTLLHDEQLQFDQIIKNGKVAAELLVRTNSAPQLFGADYTFTQSSRLEFVSSESNAGIQAADVLAGFAMRYVQKALDDPSQMGEPLREVFQMLMAFNEVKATGCNLVMSTTSINRLMRVQR